MFSPGFRLFFGFTIAGFVAMFVYGVSSGAGGSVDYLGFVDAEAWIGAISLGWKGGVGDHVGYMTLMMFAVMAAFVAIMLVAFRDADADAVAELTDGELPPAQGPTPQSHWPLIGAFGVGVVVVGLVTSSVVFAAGILVLVAVAFEWAMAAWADRATGDPAANRELRDRIMKPIEVPVLGAIGIAVLVLAMSRVFLTVSKEWAVWVAVAVSAAIFVGAIALALAESVNKNVVAGLLSVGAVAVLAGGVVSASIGEREFHHPEAEEGGHAEEGESGEGDHSEGESVEMVEEGAEG